ncbi:MAG TPA: DNA polymerase [Trueperaceae bacterium]|nr:DNA polymerase [Trueperaceae bacterium]
MAKRNSNRPGLLQLPLFTPESNWSPPDLSSLPSWAEAKRVCVDVETYDPHLRQLGIGVRRGGYVVGVSFKIEDGPGAYLPMRHQGGDNLPVEQVLGYLRENAARFSGQLVGANLPYDLDYLWEEGVYFPQVELYRDVQIAEPLIDELQMSYSLDAIAKRHGLPGKSEELLEQAARAYGVATKHGMWQLPARYVGPYAEVDTEQPLLTLRRQERIIDERDLWRIYDLESRVLPVLVRMRRRGVRVNMERLRGIETWSLDKETEALQLVRDQTGVQIAVGDVWKADALAPALHYIGVKLHQTSTGKPSIDKDLLSSIDHPVAKALAWARKVNKLRTTFAASVRTYMVNGRIHCTYNQMAREDDKGDQKGARYGRVSCVDPNLQQQPSRDEFAKMWRSIYEPEEGALWAACDYSQQEPRWTTHFAAMMDLPGAREAAQAYHDNPKLDNHQFMADLTGLDRKYAKNIYLGLCYGEGGAKLCDDLGLPTRWALAMGRGRERRVAYFSTQAEALEARAQEGGEGFVWRAAGEEGQRILDVFDARAPFIRKLARKAEDVAKARGYVVTIGGRHLHFPARGDGSYEWTHKALNRVIQGSSADQTKTAMVELDRMGHFLQLQVHDELDSSVRDREEAMRMAEVMSNCIPAEVPFRVDVEIGPSWGEAE